MTDITELTDENEALRESRDTEPCPKCGGTGTSSALSTQEESK